MPLLHLDNREYQIPLREVYLELCVLCNHIWEEPYSVNVYLFALKHMQDCTLVYITVNK